jgi:hypothetical protein
MWRSWCIASLSFILNGAELVQLNYQLELLAPESSKNESFFSHAQTRLDLLLEKIWPIIKPQGPFDQYKLEYKKELEKIDESSNTLKQDYENFQGASNAKEREKLYQKALIGN